MAKTGRARTKKRVFSIPWIYMGIVAVLFLAGYLAGGVFRAYGEPDPVVTPGDPAVTPEPAPGGGDEPEPSPPPLAELPPPGETWLIADGNNLHAVVTKQTSLRDYAPPDLLTIPEELIHPDQRRWQYYLRREALESLLRMSEAALGEGIDLVVISAYRSYATQRQLFDSYAAAHGQEAANRFSALPGHSEHQLGTAVDFGGTPHDKTQKFAGTTPGIWLAANAHRFGFAMSYPPGSEEITGYIYEPWHFRYIGVEAALAWHESGEVLSNFLRRYPQDFIKP